MICTPPHILSGLYKTSRMRWAGHVACMGGRGEVYTGFWWGKPEGKKPLGKPRHRWEDSVKLLAPELCFLILAHPVYKM
jgi:hypothetical protein